MVDRRTHPAVKGGGGNHVCIGTYIGGEVEVIALCVWLVFASSTPWGPPPHHLRWPSTGWLPPLHHLQRPSTGWLPPPHHLRWPSTGWHPPPHHLRWPSTGWRPPPTTYDGLLLAGAHHPPLTMAFYWLAPSTPPLTMAFYWLAPTTHHLRWHR